MPKSPVNFDQISNTEINPTIAAQISPPSAVKQAKKHIKKGYNLEKQLNKDTKLGIHYDQARRAREFKHDQLGVAITDETIKYAHLISKNCKQAVEAYQITHRFLYRGIGNATKKAFTSYPRSDRYPKDTKDEMHVFADKLMSQYFMATRSNSIFCTPNTSTAGGYGKVYIIFPFDGFDFTWSKQFSDMTVNVFDNHRTLDGLIMSLFSLREAHIHVQVIIDRITTDISDMEDGEGVPLPLQDPDYKQRLFTGLQNFALACTGYMLPSISVCEETLDLIQPMQMTDWQGADFSEIKETITKFIYVLKHVETPEGAKEILDQWGLTNKDFIGAIDSNHEILIRGQYYAFDRVHYEDAFRKIFFGEDHS